jgi:hypothetical protein
MMFIASTLVNSPGHVLHPKIDQSTVRSAEGYL